MIVRVKWASFVEGTKFSTQHTHRSLRSKCSSVWGFSFSSFTPSFFILLLNKFFHCHSLFFLCVFLRTSPSQFLLIEILTIFQSPFQRLCISPLHRVGRLEPIHLRLLCSTLHLQAYASTLCPNSSPLVAKDYFYVQLFCLIPYV